MVTNFVVLTCRYEERLRNIQAITNKKLMSSFEQFSENVMHPLEMTSTQSTLNMPTLASLRASPQKLLTSPISIPTKPHNHPHSHSHLPSLVHNSHKSTSSPHSTHSTHSLPHVTPQHSESHSPKGLMSSFLRLPGIDRMTGRSPPPLRRARASTNDDRMQNPPKSTLPSMLCYLLLFALSVYTCMHTHTHVQIENCVETARFLTCLR